MDLRSKEIPSEKVPERPRPLSNQINMHFLVFLFYSRIKQTENTSCECAFDKCVFGCELGIRARNCKMMSYCKGSWIEQGVSSTGVGSGQPYCHSPQMIGASVDIDVLKYDEDSCRAILRCPATSYVKLRSSLTLCGDYSGIPCAYRVRNASPCLLSLLGDSRTYQHN
uniref:Uncharacterized protein n=1 Tax=Timema monikensis TaxID=170555 RepID=A0A7R9EAU9_9NEOP|nr:unnamed protein product [Timema monikensis]